MVEVAWFGSIFIQIPLHDLSVAVVFSLRPRAQACLANLDNPIAGAAVRIVGHKAERERYPRSR